MKPDNQIVANKSMETAAVVNMHHSEEIVALLRARKAYLELAIRKVQKGLKNAPEGSLTICCRGENTYYKHRMNQYDRNGVYISSADCKTPARLAQKGYYQKVLEKAEIEKRVIEDFLAHEPEQTIEEIYPALTEARKKLVIPVYQPDEVFAEGWRTEEYEGRSFDSDYPEYTTDHGERVRSKSEIMIANMLFKQGIPYRYEYPVMLDGMGMVHPDFLILNVRLRKEILWEHLGRMDDPGYAVKNIRKLIAYARNGYMQGDNLILTAETAETPIPMDVVAEMMKKYLL